MRSVIDYVEKAKENRGFASDRQLGMALNLSSNTISMWRNRGFFPTDDTMRLLAIMADEDPDIALLHLNIWRAKHPETRESYENILTMLSKASVWAGVIAAGIIFAPGDAMANGLETLPEQASAGFPLFGIIAHPNGVVIVLIFTRYQGVGYIVLATPPAAPTRTLHHVASLR